MFESLIPATVLEPEVSKAKQDLKELYNDLLTYTTRLALQYDLDVSCAQDNPLKFISSLRDEEFLDSNAYEELEEVILTDNRAIRENAINEKIADDFEERVIAAKRYLQSIISEDGEDVDDFAQ